MSAFRYQAAGVSINSRQFLVTGGLDIVNDERVLSSCEYFDVHTQTWYNLAIDLPHPLMGHGIAFVGDMLFVFGGQSRYDWCHTPCYTARSDVFAVPIPNGDLSNLQAGQPWKRLTPMMMPRSKFAIVADDRYVYVIGGNDGSEYVAYVNGTNPRQMLQYSTAERYDVENDAWVALPNIPFDPGRPHDIGVGPCSAAGMIGNKIFIVGGKQYYGMLNQEIRIFDIATQSWSFANTYEHGDDNWSHYLGMAQHCVLTLDEVLLTIGGVFENREQDFPCPYNHFLDTNIDGFGCAYEEVRIGWRISFAYMTRRFGCVAGILVERGHKVAIVAGDQNPCRGRTAEKLSLESTLAKVRRCRALSKHRIQRIYNLVRNVFPLVSNRKPLPSKKKARYIQQTLDAFVSTT